MEAAIRKATHVSRRSGASVSNVAISDGGSMPHQQCRRSLRCPGESLQHAIAIQQDRILAKLGQSGVWCTLVPPFVALMLVTMAR